MIKSYIRISSKLLTALAAVVVLSCCTAQKGVPYLVGAENLTPEQLAQTPAGNPVIMPGDLLNIEVTSVDMASVVPFNKGLYLSEAGTILSAHATNVQNFNNNYEASTDYYLVASDGNIDFPVLGSLHVAGLTKDDVARMIRDDIYPKYLTTAPTVSVRLMNFRVTVIGAVKAPGVYLSKNEHMNFLEALALAGDLDIKGSRNDVLLYRTNADGSRSVHRIDLQDPSLLLSPWFNLQQNDLIYVQPNKSMAQNAWQLNPTVAATVTMIGGVSSLASLVVGIVNLTKN